MISVTVIATARLRSYLAMPEALTTRSRQTLASAKNVPTEAVAARKTCTAKQARRTDA